MATWLLQAALLTMAVSWHLPYSDAARAGKRMAAQHQIASFDASLDAYRADAGRYPTTDEGWAALRRAPRGAAKWAGSYVNREISLDPWPHPFEYRLLNGRPQIVWREK